MDSGLIFPIIVAMWLVYLVPQWIRRREHLAASREPDRHSEAMRVLPRAEQATAVRQRPPSGTFVLSPASAASVVASAHGSRDDDVVATHPLREPAPAAPQRPRRRSRVPGVAFLLALGALPVTVVLALAGQAPAWAPVVSLAVLVATLAVLRRSAVRRRTSARGRRRPSAPAPRRPVAARSVAAAPAAAADGASEPSAHDEPVADGGAEWTPVPVPPPTYTLKAAAPPREVAAWVPEPAAETGSQPAHPAAAAVDAVDRARSGRVMPDLDLVLERRRASGE